MGICCVWTILFLCLPGFITQVTAQRFAVTTGNWTGAIWATTAGGAAGSAATPTASDAVTINSGVVVTVDTIAECNTATLTAPTVANGITISGSNSLNVTGAITINAPTAAVNATVAVGSGSLVAASVALTGSSTAGNNSIFSISTGTATISGNFTFSGTAAQAQLTFSGAGLLTVGGTLSTGGTVTASTGTIEFNGTSQTINTYSYANVNLSGSGTMVKTASLTLTGLLTVGSSVSFNMANSNLTVGSLTGSGNITNSSGTAGARTITVGSDNSSPAAYSGTISNGTASSVALTKNGTGALILSGVNTYSGATSLSAGSLIINHDSAIGTGTLSISASTTINNNSGSSLTLTTNNPITIGGNFTFTGSYDLNLGTGAITNAGSRTITLNGTNSTLTLAGQMTNSTGGTQTTTVNGSGNTLVLGSYALANSATNRTGVFAGTGNVIVTGVVSNGSTATASSLTYSGSGRLTLQGANTFAGTFSMSAGTVSIMNDSALGRGSISFTGGTIDNGTGSTLTMALNQPITIGGNFTFGGTNNLDLGSGAVSLSNSRTITLNGTGSTLTMNGLMTNTFAGSPTLTVNGTGNTLILDSIALSNSVTSRTLSIRGSGDVIVNGVIINGGGSTTSALTENATGKLTLNGRNTYGGTTTLTLGQININTDSAIGTGAFTITAGTIDNTSGGPIALNTNNAITLGGNFTFGGSNDLNLDSGAITNAGSRTITLNGSNKTLTLGGLMTNGINGNQTTTVNGAGNTLILGSYSLSNSATSRTGIISGSANVIIPGAINNGGTAPASALTYSGTGVLTLLGSNGYGGLTSISAGSTINIQHNSALGTTTNGVTITSGGVLQLQGSITIGAEALSIAGTGISSTGALRNISGSNTWGGLITQTAASEITSDLGTLTLNVTSGNAITGTFNLIFDGASDISVADPIAISTGTVTKQGAGKLTYTGTNTYTGLTTISNGTLELGASNVISTGALTVSGSGAVFSILGFSESVGTVTLDNDASITGTSGVLTSTSTFELKSGTVSAILGGTGAVMNKTTSDTVTLSGTNTYTGGSSISAGVLNLNNAQALGTSAGTFTITGGTIDATVGGVTIGNNPMAWNGDFTFAGSNKLNMGTGTVTMNANRQVTVSNDTLTVGGTINQSALNLIKEGNGVLSFGSNSVTLDSLYIQSGSLVATSGTMSIAGEFSNNSVFQHNSGTVNFNGASQSINGSSSTTFNHLTCSSSGTKTMGTDITVSGTLTLSSAKLSIATNTLTINGTTSGWSASNSLIGSLTSDLIIGGSGALGTNLFFNQTGNGDTCLNNFTITRTGAPTITVGNKLVVYGTLTPATTASIASGGNLVLGSNSNGTARVAPVTCASCAYITGSVKVQRFIPSFGRAWRFLGAPVSGVLLSDWKDEIHITGTLGGANGFDASSSNYSSVYLYNEPTSGDLNQGWVAASAISDSIRYGRGYRVFVRGSRDDGRLDGSIQTQDDVTLDLNGPLNQGDQELPVSFTNNMGNGTDDGWCLLANPFASPIDWNNYYDTANSSGSNYSNIGSTVSIYDPSNNNYGQYNANSGGLNGMSGNPLIPSGAAFFVQATGSSPRLQFQEWHKSSGAPAQLFKSSTDIAFGIELYMNQTNHDQMKVWYNEMAKSEVDPYDIRKMYGPSVNIASITTSGLFLGLNAKPFNGQSDSIPLSIGLAQSGDYQLRFQHADQLVTDPSIPISLYDHYLKVLHNVRTDSVYYFSSDIDNKATYGNNRFTLILGLPVGIDESNTNTENGVYFTLSPTITDEQITLLATDLRNGLVSYQIVDLTGKIADQNTMNWHHGELTIPVSKLTSGIYFIRLNDAGKGNAIPMRFIRK